MEIEIVSTANDSPTTLPLSPAKPRISGLAIRL
jgi:hypothetical protein